MKHSDAGKGSKRRPRDITEKEWGENYDRIFQPSPQKEEKDEQRPTTR